MKRKFTHQVTRMKVQEPRGSDRSLPLCLGFMDLTGSSSYLYDSSPQTSCTGQTSPAVLERGSLTTKDPYVSGVVTNSTKSKNSDRGLSLKKYFRRLKFYNRYLRFKNLHDDPVYSVNIRSMSGV